MKKLTKQEQQQSFKQWLQDNNITVRCWYSPGRVSVEQPNTSVYEELRLDSKTSSVVGLRYHYDANYNTVIDFKDVVHVLWK